MPSLDHELPIKLFKNRPELAAELLGKFAAEYDEVTLAPNELSDCPPTEYRADLVAVLHKGGAAVQASSSSRRPTSNDANSSVVRSI